MQLSSGVGLQKITNRAPTTSAWLSADSPWRQQRRCGGARHLHCEATSAKRNPGKKVSEDRRSLRRGDSSVGCKLTDIPGIGRKYEALLLQSGIGTVQALQQLFTHQLQADDQQAMQYLRETIGIRNQLCCSRIISELQRRQDASFALSPGAARTTGATLCLEGNIGAGKTTFLRCIAESDAQLESDVQIVPEPVEKWQAVGGKHNLLDMYYKEPHRYAYTFQNYIFFTRMMQNTQSSDGPKLHRLLERSVFSDKMVFVRALQEDHVLQDFEVDIYNSWYDPVLKQMPSLVPDGFVYLQASPETCHRRMQRRSRSEETTVTLKYLEGLHEKHEDWLGRSGATAYSALRREPPTHRGLRGSGSLPLEAPRVLSYSPDNQLIVPASIADDLYFLDHRKISDLPRLLDQVPALIVNCDVDMDVHNADDAQRRQAAAKVRAYMSFVQQFKQLQGVVDIGKAAGTPREVLTHAAPVLPGVDSRTQRRAEALKQFLRYADEEFVVHNGNGSNGNGIGNANRASWPYIPDLNSPTTQQRQLALAGA